MNQPDLHKYRIEELEAMNTELMSQRAQLIINQRAVAHVLEDKRKAQAVEAEIADIQQRHGVALRVVK